MLTILFKMVSIYFKKQLVIPICTDVASTSCLYNNSIRESAKPSASETTALASPLGRGLKNRVKVDEMVSSSLIRHQSAIIETQDSINRKGDHE